MMPKPIRRRDFLAAAAGGVVLPPVLAACSAAEGDDPPPAASPTTVPDRKVSPVFKISLAQWSLNRMLFGEELTTLDFPKFTKDTFNLHAVEYVNSFFKDKAKDRDYLKQLKQRCEDAGVRSLLIMCDGEGALGDADEAARKQAVENHHQWVEAAKFLGCHSIRVNAQSSGTYEEQMERAADGLRRLTEFATGHDINVIVENHGGSSSNGAWLAATIEMVDHDRCGTLPDFGNFCLDWSRKDEPEAWYDRYQGVRELMPHAKAVSAKSNDFDEAGNETNTDYEKMLRIVLAAGYRGFIGIEYEGGGVSEVEGVRLTKALLEKCRAKLKSEFQPAAAGSR